MSQATPIRDMFEEVLESFPEIEDRASSLRFQADISSVLTAWKEAGEAGPDTITCLLSSVFDNFESPMDTEKVELLSVISGDLGFQLGYATLVCRLWGFADTYRGSICRCSWHWQDVESDDSLDGSTCRMHDPDCTSETGDEAEFEQIWDTDLDFENFVDFDGEEIGTRISFFESGRIPQNTDKVIQEGHYDEQEYDSGECAGRQSGTLERCYRKDVLVIWPKAKNCRVCFIGKEGFNYACTVLSTVEAPVKTAEDEKLVEFVLDGHRKEPAMDAQMITRAVCHVAFIWHDLDIWKQAVALGSLKGGLAIVHTTTVIKALQTFSFSDIRPEILPQILDGTNAEFLSSLTVSIFKDARILPTNEKTQLLSHLLQTAISRVNLGQKRPHREPYIYANTSNNDMDPNLKSAQRYVDICILLDMFDHLRQLFRKVADTNGLSSSQSQHRVKKVMLPLISYTLSAKLPDGMKTRDIPLLVGLAKHATALFLKGMSGPGADNSIKRSDVDIFMEAVLFVGGWQYFQSSILPKIESSNFPTSISFSFAEQLHRLKNQLPGVSSVQDAIDSLTHKAVMSVGFEHPKDICDILRRCIVIGALSSAQSYLDHITGREQLTPENVEYTFIGLITPLRDLGLKFNILPQFASTFQIIITTWINQCLGPRPTYDGSDIVEQFINRWKCKCVPCQTVKMFLLQPLVKYCPTQYKKRLEHCGAYVRDHVQYFLTAGAGAIAGWSTIREGGRVGLEIQLKPLRYAPLYWRFKQEKGLRHLKMISTNEDELKQLLGQHYETVVKVLRETNDGPNV
ncbi:hypothetical protein C8Q75DRAFT_802774 [Abortiporus biennis]|nr:hypothetical protein C8Q75DRAFT_802774 [Abortiporus biennis]